MNFPFFIARRYLFSKKSHNVINIISMISVFGVATGTMALIIVLSVFNGFDDLIKSVFSSFDPDLKITIKQGKVFDPTISKIENIQYHDAVELMCPVLEENVLLEYEERMYPAIIKGVPLEFSSLTGVDTMMREGAFILNDGHKDMMVLGMGVSYYLSVGLNFVSPIQVYVPKRTGRISMNPARAFNKQYIFPSGIFSVQQEIDTKYVIVPIDFTRKLLNYPVKVSAIELKLKPDADKDKVQKELRGVLGEEYVVKNRFEQHEVLYRVMKSEKWAIYMILTFILIIASFNIIGSLSMLIIDKKDDLRTFRSMGLDKDSLKKIFLVEGWMISIGGAIVGIILGAMFCWIQIKFGLIRIDSMGSFLVDSYPVKIDILDFVWVFITVVVIGIIASWYPVNFFTKRYLNDI